MMVLLLYLLWGYPPYSYFWVPVIIQLLLTPCPGVYYISVTDSLGCVVSDSVHIMSGSAHYFEFNKDNLSIHPKSCKIKFDYKYSRSNSRDASL